MGVLAQGLLDHAVVSGDERRSNGDYSLSPVATGTVAPFLRLSSLTSQAHSPVDASQKGWWAVPVGRFVARFRPLAGSDPEVSPSASTGSTTSMGSRFTQRMREEWHKSVADYCPSPSAWRLLSRRVRPIGWPVKEWTRDPHLFRNRRAEKNLSTVAAGLRHTVLSRHILHVRKLPVSSTTADMQPDTCTNSRAGLPPPGMTALSPSRSAGSATSREIS